MTNLGKKDHVFLKGGYEVTDVHGTSSESEKKYTVLISDAKGITHELVMNRDDLHFPDEDEAPTDSMG